MPSSPGLLAAAMLMLSAALSIWPGNGLHAAARLRRLAKPDDTGSAPMAGHRRRSRALLFAGLGGSAVLVTFPSVGGVLAAVVIAVAIHLFLAAPTSSDGSSSRVAKVLLTSGSLRGRLVRAGADARLPFAIDLLAVCLRGGLSPSAALRCVAAVLADLQGGGPRDAGVLATPELSIVLGRAAASGELGTDPADAWREWMGDPVYGPLARALVVTGDSGSAVAARLTSVAKQIRDAAGQRSMARAQRVGVALMAPLGLCFLPAFVCLGVAPVVVGIAGRVFG